ncbi:hypothetical protein [Cohnella cholangitidis]|uniref:Uncharacterized protein n=1 Tax=Cohnella cholangitidis TaxID=2598458 RepID=A0A7G5C377_9BACL|nr:hypothetical protein [Cohnella cholangitidis]QMV43661.1 hypothetical protein FPL14_22650 [Cohnella cholangitidis]
MNEQHDNHEQFVNRNIFSPSHDQSHVPLKHSGLGIASFVLSLVSIASFIILSIVIFTLIANAIDFTAIVDENGNRLMSDEELVDKIQPYVGYMILYPLLLVLVVIGLIIGIVALAKPGYKKVFAILGTVFNGIPLLLVALFILIGLVSM